MIDVAAFRLDYPEFNDATKYPSSAIQYWLNLATVLFTSRWGPAAPAGQPNTLYDIGVELFVAHNMAIERRALNESAAGGVPGMSSGVVTSKSVGGVSLGYATGLGIDSNGGAFNLTIYGQRLMQLINIVGMGPVTITAPGCGAGPYSGPAWQGPPMFQGVTWDD
jgi:hypothetical protein